MRLIASLITILLCAPLLAQPPGGRPPEGQRDGPPPSGKRQLVEQFDADGDGRLNRAERNSARIFMKENPARGRRGGRRSGRGRGGQPREIVPGPTLTSAQVRHYPEAELYDSTVIRTLFLEFASDDWESELTDFYRTDVTVPAKLTVDGKVYTGVGVNFRGNSSFFTVGSGQKRSLNLKIDAGDEQQRLYGYQTLNLLNAHTDPSYLREYLFATVAGHYLPAPKANFVKVVINGEYWGVYVNSQQFNRDFLRDWFGTRKGTRWKVPAGRRGGGGLTVLEEESEYRSSYQLKTDGAEDSYQKLTELCRALADTPANEVEQELGSILNIDRALWFLAVDNVLIDGDGYLSRASDYAIYLDPTGRFHMVPHDSNETFRHAGGGGPGFRRSHRGVEQPPLVGAEDQDVPLLSTLISSPALRARYLHHVRAIASEWLDWKRLGKPVEEQRSRLDPELKADVKMLTSYEQFRQSATESLDGGRRRTPSLKDFADERRAYLLAHEDLSGPWPTIASVELGSKPRPGEPTAVQIQVNDGQARSAFIYFATSQLGRFERVEASRKSDNTFVGMIPAQPVDTRVRFYAEVRNENGDRVDFHPTNTELGALKFRVKEELTRAEGAPKLFINEVMPINRGAVTDPSGEHSDWIELYNGSDQTIELANHYLTDNARKRRKWKFPTGVSIAANGYLVIWTGGKSTDGVVRASFKLSNKGETILLCSSSGAIIDVLSYDRAKPDRSIGRNSAGEHSELAPTPGRPNRVRHLF